MADLARIDKIISDDDFDNQGEDISIESAFGLWKDRDITKETLRKKAWAKNCINSFEQNQQSSIERAVFRARG
ncbi:MAG: hypothetical protein FWG66_06005 [Spirochaetes bacterium]|nr:hypothetical protein [Spirochaetota bacterium]